MDKKCYRLYVITDRTWLCGRLLEQDVEKALRGGASLVQIREKGIRTHEFIARAQAVKCVCDAYQVPLLINDIPEVAKAIGAAGVHLGASDGDLRAARAYLGEHAVLGATAKTVETARAAQAAGADYLGCGAVFGSTTKADAKTISPEQFAAVASAVTIPVVAIGGVTAQNAKQLSGCRAAGLCAISSVFAQPDIEQAARQLRAVADEVCI